MYMDSLDGELLCTAVSLDGELFCTAVLHMDSLDGEQELLQSVCVCVCV